MKIKFTKNFIEQRNVVISDSVDGSMEINIDGDFLVFLNHKNVFAVADFKRNKKGQPCDDTLPIKDLLVDQLQYVDFIQKDDKEESLIDFKFNIKEGNKYA